MTNGTGSVSLYRSNYFVLKSLDGESWRLVHMKRSVRQSGVFEPTRSRNVNEEKLETNLIRARSTVRDLAYCNKWDWWCTLTINKEKRDRNDLKAYRKAFKRFVSDLRKQGNPIRYLLVAERHKDGNWHMHGFLAGVHGVMPNKYGYWDWPDYYDKFGYISLSRIKSKERAANYIVKYMTKDLERSVKELGEHMYCASQGLKRPKTERTGICVGPQIPADWENEYVAQTLIRDADKLKLIDSSIAWDDEPAKDSDSKMRKYWPKMANNV